jgi:hypothetical protein
MQPERMCIMGAGAGGDGTIGGGCCKLRFTVGPKGGPHTDKWDCDDGPQGKPVELTITIPKKLGVVQKGDNYTVTLKDENDVVGFHWEHPDTK